MVSLLHWVEYHLSLLDRVPENALTALHRRDAEAKTLAMLRGNFAIIGSWAFRYPSKARAPASCVQLVCLDRAGKQDVVIGE